MHSLANPDGTQKIENTGPLTKKRMETIDDEITARAVDFIERQQKAGKPFFVWMNPPTCTSALTPSRRAWDRRGVGSRNTTTCMIDHDKNVGTDARQAR